MKKVYHQQGIVGEVNERFQELVHIHEKNIDKEIVNARQEIQSQTRQKEEANLAKQQAKEKEKADKKADKKAEKERQTATKKANKEKEKQKQKQKQK